MLYLILLYSGTFSFFCKHFLTIALNVLNVLKITLIYHSFRILCVRPFCRYFFFSFSKDINECLRNTHSCHINATCTNTEGSFYCNCNVGYTGNGTFCTGENTYCTFFHIIYVPTLHIRYFTSISLVSITLITL